MQVWNDLHQTVTNTDEYRMENLSSVCQKQKRKKNMKKLSFITWFTIEFLLLFTGWREVLGKMPEIIINSWHFWV